jgi:micrococcal nuclease
MYRYRCKVLRVVDGDTIDVDIDLGFGVWMHRERVRIMGIDTPESRTRDLVEKQFGLAAKEYVKTLMPVGSMQIIKTQKDKTGKFGRILGDFELEGGMFTEIMIDNHHAVAYNGQNKEDVKESHLRNRAILIENGSITLKE